jgi:[protein-PII] uridylyltransferase
MMHPVYDEVLSQLAEHFLSHWRDRVAVIALGGYGRREMSPYSDIDILFLKADDTPEGVYTGIRNILRLLWDSKVELGHSVRSVQECRAEADKDLSVLTTLMDVRPVWGDEALFRRLKIERDALLQETDPLEIYLRVEGELAKTSQAFSHTIYLLEPYVKEGPGSLRYMQLITWLTRIVYGTSRLEDLPILGVCGRKSVAEAEKGFEFLAEVRTRLHFLSRRRDDRLRFDAQVEIAKQMGFTDSTAGAGVQSFMREYYRHAATNEFFGERVLARARLMLWPKAEQDAKTLRLDHSFYVGAGGINRNDPAESSLTEGEIVQAFRWVAQVGCDLDIRLADLIRNRLRSIEGSFAGIEATNSLFLDMFRSKGAIARALTSMLKTGVLERLVPEFESVRYLRLMDAYHEYTVDRHSMELLECFDAFRRAGREGREDLMPTIFSRLEKPEILYLAGLFHDIGKGRGPGHEQRGEVIARPILKRMGLPEADVEEVCFLIRNHLAMSQLAFKKDLHDEGLLSRFAETVMQKRLLDMLLLLTYADLSAVGAGGVNSWKEALLEELYYRTLSVLEGQSAQGEDLAEWCRQIRDVVTQHVPESLRGPQLEQFLLGAPSRYLLDFYPGVIADHYVSLQTYLNRKGMSGLGPDDIITQKVDHHRPGYSAITLITRFRHGLFFRIAGALSANRINIMSAWSHKVGGDAVVATFHVEDVGHGPIADPDRWKKFQDDVASIISGRLDVDQLVAKRRRSWKPPRTIGSPVRVEVRIDNAASDRATIVEVYAQDRPGLLYDITRKLALLGLTIVLTKITTEVDRAADVFYVVDEHGGKIADFDRLEEIRRSLKDHLAKMQERMTASKDSPS